MASTGFKLPAARLLSRTPYLVRDFAIVAVVVALTAFSAYQSRLHYQQQARMSADNLSQVLGDHIGSAIEKIDLVLRSVVRDVVQQQARGTIDPHDLELALAQQQQLLIDARELMIADASGIFRYGTDVPPGFRIDISDLDYFKGLRDDPTRELVISGPYQSRVGRQWVMVFARRMTHPDGSFAGIVSAAISADHFRELLSSLNLGAHGTAILRTGDLGTVARFPRLGRTEAVGSKLVPSGLREGLAANPDYGIFRARGPADEVERTIAYRKLPGFPFYVMVGLATQDYLAPWRDEALQLAGIAGAFIVIALWLSRTARQATLRQQATSRLLEEAVDSVAVGFAIFDPQDRLVICNGAVRDFSPCLDGALVPGARFPDILRGLAVQGRFPEALEDMQGWLQERLRCHRAADGRPAEIKLQDGRQIMLTEHRTPGGHVVINGIDITELSQYRRHLEGLVDTRTAELKAALDQSRILVELSPTALAMLDRDLRYLATSRRWLEAYGDGWDSLAGRQMYEVHPDFPESWKAVHRAALAGVADSRDEDLWIGADGGRHWLRWAVHPWIDASGRVGGIIVSTEDITDRKEAERALAEEREARQAILERQVAERTAQLQTTNTQLEGFLYAASHDLRGALGRISNFSTLLERNYRDRLEGDGILFLNFIRENALRVTKLVDDLLSHARIDQQATRLQPIDLPAAIGAALAEQAEDIEAAAAAVRVEVPAARVLADPYGLGQVLHNLLENALKYTAQTPDPAIEIGGEASGGRFRLWVRDNGIGFDMDYHDKIFEIFRRLHTYTEYAGSGVGLALVKRAMERMGGAVWAESEPGRGATFYLEFAMADAAEG
ncbi:MAG TPA: ATP-binding protein [Rhodocyclaceae bacterium]|nr:ATP-binding protein [Rhodocyclaceae bacterium]